MMTSIRALVARVVVRADRSFRDTDLDDELQAHLEMLADDYVRRGMAPEEARRQARLHLGGIEQTKEKVRDARASWVDSVGQDVRYALRRIRREPGFAAVAILTIGLAVGLNTAIFSVTRTVLLRPLPYHDPDRLVLAGKGDASSALPSPLSEPEYLDWLERNQAFESMGAWTGGLQMAFVDRSEPEPLVGAQISSSLLPTLGVKPLIGRTFRVEDERPGQDRVVILSEGAWRRLFNADPAVIGRRLRLQALAGLATYEVVGVLPSSFRLHYATSAGPFRARSQKGFDLFAPLVPTPGLARDGGARRGMGHQVIARLAPGLSLDQARGAMRTLAAQLNREYPSSSQRLTALLVPLHEATFGKTRPAVWLLTAAVALVLLVGCTNVAHLLLARGSARGQEMAIRAALGSGRGRLFQQLLTENLVLAALGGLAGMLMAAWSSSVLVHLLPPEFARADELRVDRAVLAFATAVSLLSGVLFGIGPALSVSRGQESAALKAGASSAGRAAVKLRSALVAAQVAVLVVLLGGAGLLLNTIWRMARVDVGFAGENTAVFMLLTPYDLTLESAGRQAFYSTLVSRVRAMPGVVEACMTHELPFANGSSYGAQIPGVPGIHSTEVFPVDDQYLSLMRIAILEGRTLGSEDGAPGRVAVVNQAFAERYFPGRSPLGRQVVLRDAYEIVGIVSNHREMIRDDELKSRFRHQAKGQRLASAEVPAVYVPAIQAPWAGAVVYLLVRTADDPAGHFRTIRRQIAQIEPTLAVTEVSTLAERVDAPLAGTRFYAIAVLAFALVAVVLAIVGLYGVLAQTVGRRAREIGIRRALGATTVRVVSMVVAQVAALVALGVAVGLVIAWNAAHLLRSFLFEVSPTDPWTFGGVVVVLVLAAAAASYAPARRAARLNPVEALRAE